MKRITVIPLKSVNGVSFGESRMNVRKEFGKCTEKAKGKMPNGKTAPSAIDDFGYCEVYYNANNKMECVSIDVRECRVIIGSTNVDTSSYNACMKSMNMKAVTDYKRSISIGESDGKIIRIIFGNRAYFGETPTKDDADKTDTSKKDSGKSDKNIGTKDAPMKESPDAPMSDLTRFYDELKNQLNKPAEPSPMMRVGGGMMPDSQHPGALAFRQKALDECDKLKEKCCKHMILDIYCHVLPLDADYIHGHHGQMCSDVDNMLASKNMSATQYLTSCSDATKAPLLEFVMRAIDNIGKAFMEKADEELKDAQKQDIEAAPPEAPDPEDDEEVSNQLVDVQKDTEYEDFIDKLKQKTINKIVKDVSKIITDKKEEEDMKFDPKPSIADQEAATESTVSAGINYLQRKVFTEKVSIGPDMQDQIIGMAIREATLNEIDACFNQKGTDYKSFAQRLRMGRGVVINESAAKYLTEHVASV